MAAYNRGASRYNKDTAMTSVNHLDGFLQGFENILKLVEPARVEIEQLQKDLKQPKLSPAKYETEYALQCVKNELQAHKEDNDRLAKHAEDMRLQRLVAEKERLNAETRADHLQNKIDGHEQLQKDLRENCNELQATIDKQTKEITELKNALETASQEKENASMATRELQAKVRELGENRPTATNMRASARDKGHRNESENTNLHTAATIASLYDQVYDNQWSEAFEVSMRHFSVESERTNSLCDILLSIYTFCEKHRQEEYSKVVQTLMHGAQANIEEAEEIVKLLSDCRHNLRQTNISTLIEPLRTKIAQSETQIAKVAIQAPEFVQGCLQVCWSMVMETPPLVFAENPVNDATFDGTMYKHYTKTGDKVDFVVWPAILLHADGPVVAKGVVECYKSSEYEVRGVLKRQRSRVDKPTTQQSPRGVQSGSRDKSVGGGLAKKGTESINLQTPPNTEVSATQQAYPKEKMPLKVKMDSYNRYKQRAFSDKDIRLLLGTEAYKQCKEYDEWLESQTYTDC